VGFWTGKQFVASGLHVTAWGWQETDPLDSFEASRLVAQAVGHAPSVHACNESTHDAKEDKPRAFHIVYLYLPSGREMLGMWDGKAYIHQGHEVEPVSWKALHFADPSGFSPTMSYA
jgi:hypothetical protein